MAGHNPMSWNHVSRQTFGSFLLEPNAQLDSLVIFANAKITVTGGTVRCRYKSNELLCSCGRMLEVLDISIPNASLIVQDCGDLVELHALSVDLDLSIRSDTTEAFDASVVQESSEVARTVDSSTVFHVDELFGSQLLAAKVAVSQLGTADNEFADGTRRKYARRVFFEDKHRGRRVHAADQVSSGTRLDLPNVLPMVASVGPQALISRRLAWFHSSTTRESMMSPPLMSHSSCTSSGWTVPASAAGRSAIVMPRCSMEAVRSSRSSCLGAVPIEKPKDRACTSRSSTRRIQWKRAAGNETC